MFPRTRATILCIWASFLISHELLVGQPYNLSLSPSKTKLGGESHIYSPPKVGQTALSAATCPDSCRAHRRQVSRVMAWRQVATGVTPLPHQLRLQDSVDFGSKFGYLSRKAPRVRCPTHVGSAAGGANFAAAHPTFPIFAHSCPFLLVLAL